MVGVSAFEFGNVAATLLILRASELLSQGQSNGVMPISRSCSSDG
jgi:hypothetical protein